MKTKILSGIIMAMVAVFALSMTLKEKEPIKKLAPGFACPYPVRNYLGCAIEVSYEYVDAANVRMCWGNITVNPGSPGITVIPCCAGAANIYINVYKINSSPVFQSPASVSGPAGFGNIQLASGSTTCATGMFYVAWTAGGTNVTP